MSKRVEIDLTARNKTGSTFNEVGHQFNKLRETVFALFAVDKVGEFVKSTLELGEAIKNQATSLGATVEQTQILSKAAKDAGVSFDKLQSSIGRVSALRAKALGGDASALNTFSQLGISKEKLQSSSSYDILFKSIGDTIKNGKLDSIALPLSQVLGRGFDQMIPLFKTNLDEVGDGLKSMGAIISNQSITELAELNSALDTLKTAIQVNFIPVFLDSIQSIAKGISAYLHFIDGITGTDKKKKDNDNSKSTMGQDIIAGGKGIVGLGAVALGGGGLFGQNNRAYQYGVTKIMEANNIFDSLGQNGALSAAADRINQNKSLGDDFDAKVKKIFEPAKENETTIIAENKNKVIKKAKGKPNKIYSDSLTSVGNMLGSNFNNMGSVTSLMEVNKQQLSKLSIMVQNGTELKQLMQKVVDKFQPSNSNWMTTDF